MSARALLALLLAVAAAVVFAPVVGFDFVNLDDRLYVARNPHVLNGLSLEGVLWAFTTDRAANWHPLTWLSLMLDAEIAGDRPAIYHWTNLLLHVANTLLLFHLLDRTTGLALRAAAVAALFAIHPLHVESVAWISERKDVLSTFLGLLAVVAYARAGPTPGRGRRGAVAGIYALSLLAKPMLVTLPLLLLLLDRWPLGRAGPRGARPWSVLVREKTPLFALAAASALITLVVQFRAGAVSVLEQLPFLARVENALVAYATYLVRALAPTGLAVLYPHPGTAIPAWHAFGCALILAGLTLVALRAARSRPWALVGWLWYLVTLLPVLGLVQVGKQATADRYTYLALVGPFWIVVWGLPEVLARFVPRERAARLLAAVVAVAALAVLGVAARRQVETWRNSRALFEHALAVTRENSLAHSALATTLAREGSDDAALGHYREALRIEPDFAQARAGMAEILLRRGRVDEAIAAWEHALADAPRLAEARVGLGRALLIAGRTDEAIVRLEESLAIDPRDAAAHGYLAGALLARGRIDEAVPHAEEALRLDPKSAAAHHNLGLARAERGDLRGAEESLRAAIGVDPTYADSRLSLGVVLARQGRLDEAAAEFERVLSLNPGDARARTNLERVLATSRAR